jgi:16S rRNA (uracil1498-N3)-methyltransferase
MSGKARRKVLLLRTMIHLLSLLNPAASFGSRLGRVRNINHMHHQFSNFHSSVTCRLNRFLFDPSEIDSEGQDAELTVTLTKDDYRTVHAFKTLNLENGDTVRAGLVSCDEHDGLVTDEAVVEWIPEGKKNKYKPPGLLQLRLDNLKSPPMQQTESSVSLILALPRPLQLGRILPMIAQLGVYHLVLTESRKVPRDYFGSHLFRKPQELRLRLVEGLCQAGDVKLPQLHVVRNLSRFLEEDLDTLFPPQDYARVIAHPQRDPKSPELRMRDVKFPNEKSSRIVVAVGPEGGWVEPDELERFQRHGFTQITLGSRTLRSDVAVVSLLSLAHDACESNVQ